MLIATWNVLLELAPWLLLGTVVSALLHGLLPANFVHRHLGGRFGVPKAVALGVPLPLCSCGVIPAGLGLKKDGASDGAAVGFLISTPQTGVDSIMVSASFLGWPFAIFKLASATVTGLVGGLLTDLASDRSKTETDATPAPRPDGGRPPPREMLTHGVDVLRTIWRWLVFGVLVSAAITSFVPASFFQGLAAHGELAAMGAVLLVSLPMYVCATASVPIAAALVAGGLPPGAALVFLMAGPATNVATIGAIHRGLGPRALGIYLATIVLGSMGLGWAFGAVIDPSAVRSAHAHAHQTWWAIASAVVLLGLLGRFVFEDLRRLWERHRPVRSAPTHTVELGGVVCGGCTAKIEEALRAADGVTGVSVGIDPPRAIVRGPIATDEIRRLIREAGYEVMSIESESQSPTVEVGVSGMKCGGCVSKLEGALRGTEGVDSVEVTLEPGRAVVHGRVDAEKIREVVRASGFEPA